MTLKIKHTGPRIWYEKPNNWVAALQENVSAAVKTLPEKFRYNHMSEITGIEKERLKHIVQVIQQPNKAPVVANRAYLVAALTDQDATHTLAKMGILPTPLVLWLAQDQIWDKFKVFLDLCGVKEEASDFHDMIDAEPFELRKNKKRAE